MSVAIPENNSYNQRVEIPKQPKSDIIGECIIIVSVEALDVRKKGTRRKVIEQVSLKRRE